MNWLDFEVRMRDVIKELLQPAVEVAEQDREYSILLDKDQQNLRTRVKRLELAILNLDETGEKTYFDKMDDKLSELKIFVEQNIQKIHDRLNAKFIELEDFAFQQN